MAAIKISESQVWVVARWLCENLLVGVNELLPAGSRLKAAVETAIAHGGEWLDLRELERSDRREFAQTAAMVLERTIAAGTAASSTLEGYTGTVEQVRGLLQMLQAEDN